MSQVPNLCWEDVAETGSTNADLVLRARDGAIDGPVIRSAHRQTAGRGRQGRPWASSSTALAISVAMPMATPPAGWSGLSLAVGVGVADALTALAHSLAAAAHREPQTVGAALNKPADPGLQLKWPNDVLLADGRKLVGILIESVLRQNSVVVVGVGVNIALSDDDRQALGGRAADLGDVLADLGAAAGVPAQTLREHARKAVGLAVVQVLQQFDQTGFAPFRPRFEARMAYRHRDVVLIEHGDIIARGQLAGLAPDGALLLQTDVCLQSHLCGDLSLRPEGGA